jgi:Tfp pilus assembly protein PilN
MTIDTQVRAAALPRVNLMPPEIAHQRRVSQLRALLMLIVALAVAGVGFAYMNAKEGVASAQDRLNAEQAEHATLQSKLNSLAHVRAMAQTLAAREALLVSAKSNEVLWSQYLNDLRVSVPNTVWLTDLQMTQTTQAMPGGAINPIQIGTVTFNGEALHHSDVATWLETLSKIKGNVSPYFSTSTSNHIGQEQVADFTSTVNITTDRLAGRCQPGSC